MQLFPILVYYPNRKRQRVEIIKEMRLWPRIESCAAVLVNATVRDKQVAEQILETLERNKT